jgi:hypothetical protein
MVPFRIADSRLPTSGVFILRTSGQMNGQNAKDAKKRKRENNERTKNHRTGAAQLFCSLFLSCFSLASLATWPFILIVLLKKRKIFLIYFAESWQ